MPAEPTRISTRAWLTRSALTTGPIVVRLAWEVIGPSVDSSAVTSSPSLPSVGSSSVLPGTADGDGPGDATTAPEVPGLALPDGPTLGGAEAAGLAEAAALPAAEAIGEAAGLVDAAGLLDAAGLPDAPAEPLVPAVGTAVASGCCGWSPSGSRNLISTKPEPVLRACASMPCSAKTASTWSGVTAWSWNLISQRVPPV